MKDHEIYIIQGKEYKELTKQLLEACDLAGRLPEKHKLIGMKPNLVSPSDPSQGAVTHPEVVAGIIEYLQERDYRNLVVLEGSWVGDVTGDSLAAAGYEQMLKDYDVPFVDTQKDSYHSYDCDGMELQICDKAMEVDFLINVPVMKGHCQTKITCALKNMKGLIPNREKRHFHTMGLHKPIAHLNKKLHQDFVVVDSICGDWDFEDGGNPVVLNRIMAVADPVLCDAYVCRLMGYQKEEVPYLSMAEELGVGNADLTRIQVENCGSDPLIPLPLVGRKIVDIQDAVEEVESCSACYGYLMPALQRLKEEGLLSSLDEKICIGQGYRKCEGHLGIGSCTGKFTHSLAGCPPMPDEIYEFLKNYIISRKTV